MKYRQSLLILTAMVLLLALMTQNYELLGFLSLLYRKDNTDNNIRPTNLVEQAIPTARTTVPLMYPCHHNNTIWRKPSKKPLVKSLTETKECKDPVENLWGDTLELITYRTQKAISAKGKLYENLSTVSYSKLSPEAKNNWHKKVLEKPTDTKLWRNKNDGNKMIRLMNLPG